MKTSDPELMRAANRYHIIDVIRGHGPIARVEIAERTQLSPATVSAITGGLIEEGLITARRVESVENGARGRPRVLLELNADAHRVVGVKLSEHRISISVADARGESLGGVVLPVRLARQTPEVIADLVEDGVRDCVGGIGLAMQDISGIGIGLPGLIDADAGISHWSPILGPAPVPFASAVRQRLGTRTLIENDANLVTLAEHWFGHGRGLATFAVVTVENTVGMGLLVDGRLYRGVHGIGPEFGHMKFDPAGPLCRCGQRGCLDAYASDAGILRIAAAEGAGRGRPGATHQAIAALAEQAQAGDAGLRAVFTRAGEVLGAGIANVINLLNPPRIVVSGEGLRAGEMLRAPLLGAVEANVLPPLRETTEIVFHQWGDEMWARGAASIVLRALYEEPSNGAVK